MRAFLVVTLWASSLFAAPISSGEFSLQLPATWKVQKVPNGYDVAGPAGATLRIRTYAIKGGTLDAEGRKAAKRVGAAALEAVQESVRHNSLNEQIPPRTKTLKGASLDEALFTTSDALRYLAFYVLSGKASVLVATIEGDAREIKQILSVRAALVQAGGGEKSP
jgi:hypothetical protein